jgi:hypothetical protein
MRLTQKGTKFVAVEVASVAEEKFPPSEAHSGTIEVQLSRGRSILVEPGFDAHQ